MNCVLGEISIISAASKEMKSLKFNWLSSELCEILCSHEPLNAALCDSSITPDSFEMLFAVGFLI